MSEEEVRLFEGAALRAPSAQLDARMRELLSQAPADRVRVPLWQCGLACAATAVAAFTTGYAMQPFREGALTEVIYVVDSEDAAGMLDWTRLPREVSPAASRPKQWAVVEVKNAILTGESI